jgi:hypothetical protein
MIHPTTLLRQPDPLDVEHAVGIGHDASHR